MSKKLYDIHFHAMDLSHANITAFINRFIKEGLANIIKNKLAGLTIFKKIITLFLLPVLLLILLPLIILVTTVILIISVSFPNSRLTKSLYDFIKNKIIPGRFIDSTNKIRNLLSFMESSTKYDFLITEYFLKNRNPKIVASDNTFTIGNTKFNKIVLCPLIMDFGYKNLKSGNIFYNIPPEKPIKLQTIDLLIAIRTYFSKTISIKNEHGINKFKITENSEGKEAKLFEIYPFMGINTKNYTLKEVETLLLKYFGDFDKEDLAIKRKTMLYNKMGEFNYDLDDYNECKNIFAGIKLYPPLGFEPWPTEYDERKKVELLYEISVNKNIPIIVHCSTGGFLVENSYKEFSNPAKQWSEVLAKYPGLKINFAHFGSGNKNWKKTIINHIQKGINNVYTDFSCNTQKDLYYKKLANNNAEHFLFG